MESRNKHLNHLDDNCVAMAILIDSLDSFGDVSEYDFSFLDKVLPHCTEDQLSHIENCTKKVDLSSITDKLWKGFYKREFGGRAVEEMMKKSGMSGFKWSEVYKAKRKSLEEEEMGLKMKRMYDKENERKLGRQVKVIPANSCNNKRIDSHQERRKEEEYNDKIKKQYDNSLEKKNLHFTNLKRSQVFKL